MERMPGTGGHRKGLSKGWQAGPGQREGIVVAWEPLHKAWSSTGPPDPSWVALDGLGCRGLLGVPRGKKEVEVESTSSSVRSSCWQGSLVWGWGVAGAQKGRCAGLGPMRERGGGGVRRRNFAGSDWADRGKASTVAQRTRGQQWPCSDPEHPALHRRWSV